MRTVMQIALFPMISCKIIRDKAALPDPRRDGESIITLCIERERGGGRKGSVTERMVI